MKLKFEHFGVASGSGQAGVVWFQTYNKADNRGYTIAETKSEIDVGVENTGIKGEEAALQLVADSRDGFGLQGPISKGTKLPIVVDDLKESVLPAADGRVAFITVDEDFEAGDTRITGELTETLDTSISKPFYIVYPQWQLTSDVQKEGSGVTYTDGLDVWYYRDSVGTLTEDVVEPKKMAEYEITLPHRLPTGNAIDNIRVSLGGFGSMVEAFWDNITLSFAEEPDKTVAIAQTEYEGASVEISNSTGDGPLTTSPRPIRWIPPGTNDIYDVRGWSVGQVSSDENTALVQVRAEDRLKQYTRHARTLTLTTRRRRGEGAIGGGEIVSYDSSLWWVRRVETRGKNQSITMTEIQSDPYPITTNLYYTDDADKVKVNANATFASRR